MLIVIKVGGSILKEVPPEIVCDIKNVLSKHQLVLVHLSYVVYVAAV